MVFTLCGGATVLSITVHTTTAVGVRAIVRGGEGPAAYGAGGGERARTVGTTASIRKRYHMMY